MDKAILKKFAIESRQDLMQKIESKIKLFFVDETFSKQQNGDVYVLFNEKHTLSLSKEDYDKRELLIKRIQELGIEQVIEEAAYTWFNRIVAIRYMEINDYLPLTKDNQSLGIRVLSSKDNTPDPEIMKFTNLVNPELDIDFKKEKYVELKDDNDKFKYVLLLVCKKLGKVIPQVFDGITDYIDILIPDNLLNDTGFITKIVTEVPENNYNQVEIIGWLYQYYISEKKDEVFADLKKNIKIKKENIPSATQIFTPDWIVKYMVENTLGRYTSQEFRKRLKYYVENKSEIVEKKDIRDVIFLDPCCGSGHILVYAFTLFYNIYLENGFNKKDIPELILKNNIYGLDIDDRAGQLAILSVLLKAREIDKDIFNKEIIRNINIMSIQESSQINCNCIDNINNNENRQNAQYLINTFKNAKEIGSLLLVENIDYSELLNEINSNDTIFGLELQRLIPIIKCANILSKRYDVVVTNPPYMGNRGMDVKLADYVKKHYNDYKTDMFSTFIKQAYNLTKDSGYYAMITQPTFLFISSFEKVRDDLINKNSIISLLHMGRGIFGIDFGSASFVVKKKVNNDYCGSYFRLNKRTFQYIEIQDIENMFLSAKDNLNFTFDFDNYKCNEQNDIIDDIKYIEKSGALKVKFETIQSNFNKIPGKSFAYWISDNFIKCFENKKLSDYGVACVGLQTSDNKRFLREWYEVNLEKIGFGISNIEESIKSKRKWFPYNKGGDYRKWYGNTTEVVNWENDGAEIREYNNYLNSTRSSNIGIANTQYYFKESGSWGLVSSGKFSVRYSPKGAIFDTGGSSLFSSSNIKYLIGLLNTKLVQEIMHIQNPTLNYQPGNVAKVPIVFKNEDRVKKIVEECINLSKQDWDSFETSWDFSLHPLLAEHIFSPQKIKEEEENGFLVENTLEEAYKHWEISCNERFNKLKENEEELNRIFIEIYGLQEELTPNVEDKDITIRKADKLREIKSLISYAVGCMFGRYSLDEDGLIFAGGEFDIDRYKLYKPDVDNIIPITDESYFGDDIVERFKDFIRNVYGRETFNENLDFIAEVLGKKGTETSEETIRRYFNNEFYSDHIKMYQKKPIYWLFDSGKKNGFKALIYMHRYNENTVPKVRLDYLHRIQTTYEKLLTDVNYKLTTELSMTEKKEAQKRQADLNSKLQEIKEYDEKIAHIANQRISIDLDDGVTVNYDKFKDILAKIK